MLTLEKRDRIRSNVRQFTDNLPESVGNREFLINAFDEIMEEVVTVEMEKVSSSDIKLLIVEMREGFKRIDERFESVDKRFESIQLQMDNRFESMDKRFESLQIQMDKRFESMDKRFESLQIQMDKRFESMDKRFESLQIQMDKRFENVDKRFSSLQWFMGIGLTMLALLITLFGYLKPPITPDMMEKAIISGIEKSKTK
jgi:flagellar capping protein FliD